MMAREQTETMRAGTRKHIVAARQVAEVVAWLIQCASSTAFTVRHSLEAVEVASDGKAPNPK